MIPILCFACFVLGYFANDIARSLLTKLQRERAQKRSKRGGVHYPQTPLAGRIVPTTAPEPLRRAATAAVAPAPPPIAKPPAGLRFKSPDEAVAGQADRPRLRFAPVTASPRIQSEEA